MTGNDARFEVIIVGAGPGGLAAGAQAARRGLSHVLLERGELAETIARYQKGKHVMDTPVNMPVREEVVLSFTASTREDILANWTRTTAEEGTQIRVGPGNEVLAIEGGLGDFRLTLKDGSRLSGERIVLAIGLQGNPRRFGVPGDDLPHVGYQLDDPSDHIDKRIIVVGTGDAGIENAVALSENNDVTILNRRQEFDRAKAGNRALVESRIKSGAIVHLTDSQVQRFEPGAAIVETPRGEVRLEADMVLGRLGALPPRKLLEEFGIKFPSEDRAAVPVISETYESNVPGIHLIGSLVGYPLIKQALNQGYEVIEHILGNTVVPADESILQEKFRGVPGSVSEVLARIQETLPLFHGLTRIQLREFLVDSSILKPEPGAVIFERNDFSDEFYSILDGTVEVLAPAADADSDLARAKKAAEGQRISLKAGDFFGEMSLVSGRRRTATIVAGPGCVLIQTPRMSMNKLLNSVADVKRVIDEGFMVRKLQTSLAPGKPVGELRELARAAVVESYKQGELLFEEGDVSTGLILIRRGSVTVSRRDAGREMILAYLPSGNVVGEMATLSSSALRSASVRANVATEAIRIPPDAIGAFLARHPDLEAHLAALQARRLVENAARASSGTSGDIANFLMSAGAGEATDMILIDESLCVGCDNCEKACAHTHDGVSRLDREAGPSFASIHIPTSCRHCENPKCMTECPPDALRRHPNGEVFIMDNCIGCGNCASNCPYGVIQMAQASPRNRRGVLARLLFGEEEPAELHDDSVAKKAVKCDLCQRVPGLEDSREKTACVLSCPTGAILRVNPKAYIDDMMRNR